MAAPVRRATIASLQSSEIEVLICKDEVLNLDDGVLDSDDEPLSVKDGVLRLNDGVTQAIASREI